MLVSVYFVKPRDTAIASRDPGFVESLESTATRLPGFRTARRPDLADLILVDERYDYRTWRYSDELRRCRFVRQYAGRLCVINHDSYARVFLPGLYVSLEKSRPPLVDAMSVPYKRDLWCIPEPDGFLYDPNEMYAFLGTFHTHRVRRRICRALASHGNGTCREVPKAFHDHDKNDQRVYIDTIRNASFSLCPRGLSPSSYRLYESMQLGRCPVIISDDWLPPDGPDWTEFMIKVSEKDVGKIGHILEINLSRADEMGKAAFDAWGRYFSWPARREYFLQKAVELHAGRTRDWSFEELSDIWSSREFRSRYDWTLCGRGKQFVARRSLAIYRCLKPATSGDG